MDSRLIIIAARVSCDFKGQMSGGRADLRDVNDFDSEQLLAGALVELEHTDDIMLAVEIAMDHLSEFDNYYVELKKMEDELKSKVSAVDSNIDKSEKNPTGYFYKYVDSSGNEFFLQTKETKAYSPFTRETTSDPTPVKPSEMTSEIRQEREEKREEKQL
jgi:hypothetical protein